VKISFLRISTISVSLAAAALLAAATIAQDTQSAPQNPPAPGTQQQGGRNYPPPTNLKVLPKDLTGAQVHDIMHRWAGDLGQECSACHAPYADHRVDPRGRPQLDFASDEKPEKQMARIMFQMTETIKRDYVPKVAALDTMDSPAPPVTCGTCHRGHLDPEEFVPPRRDEHETHPPAAPSAPAAPPGN
jgi:hypothetical protein